eukprot:GHVP01065626.1.p1 GENE.GHVP01065626.1~~GHVP01065626.1.p1  ORF type:complete len:1088 (-),score=198.43 GHVP01065626.1:30-3293(-)
MIFIFLSAFLVEVFSQNPRVDCYPILLQDSVPYLPWVDGTDDDKWAYVETECLKISNCMYNANSFPPCTYIDSHRWTTGPVVDIGDELSFQEIYRDPAVVGEQFPDYRDKYPDYPEALSEAKVLVMKESSYRLRIKIEDPKEERFEVPDPWGAINAAVMQSNSSYSASLVSNGNFVIDVTRTGGGSIFNTDYPGFVFEDQYMQITTKLASEYVYGWGEFEHPTFKHSFDEFERKILWTRPSGVAVGPNLYGHHNFILVLDPVPEGHNAYGIFLKNSNAQEVDKHPGGYVTYRALGGILDFYIFMGPKPEDVVAQYFEAMGRPYLVPYWSLGFHLCQYGYMHLDVVKDLRERMIAAEIPFDVQHHDIDYMDQQKDFTIDPINYQGLKEFDLLLQSEGRSVVIMLDPALTFGHLQEYNDRPGFVGGKPYPPSDEGFDLDIWVMIEDPENPGQEVPLIGKVWPDADQIVETPGGDWVTWALEQMELRKTMDGYPQDEIQEALDNFRAEDASNQSPWTMCHVHLHALWNFQCNMCRAQLGFPDFWKKTTSIWWKANLKEFHNDVPYDAIWIDMNEPENFVHGSYNWHVKEDPEDWTWEGGSCPDNRWNFPPYVLKDAAYYDRGMGQKSLCPSSTQIVHGKKELFYNVHSLYGASYSHTTWEASREVSGKRSFVFSRSTFPGVGQYIGHWLGDNDSIWQHLQSSIIGQLEFNLFGIPFVGPDVCGFFSDSYEDLCMRWTQLGAFYGFWRNHNTKWARKQDPAAFNDEFSAAAKRVHETRYRILPYVYTQFYKVHSFGGTVARSIMAEFLNTDSDPRILTQDKSFMFGPSILVAPAIDATEADPNPPADTPAEHTRQAIKEVDVYLPVGLWYDFYTGEPMSGGQVQELYIPLYSETAEESTSRHVMRDIGLFLRGGYGMFHQDPETTTTFSRINPMNVLLGADSDGKASAELFWDDGDSPDTVEKGEYHLSTVDLMKSEVEDDADAYVIKIKHPKVHDVAANLEMGLISVYGFDVNVESGTRATFHKFGQGNVSSEDFEVEVTVSESNWVTTFHFENITFVDLEGEIVFYPVAPQAASSVTAGIMVVFMILFF